MIYIVLVNYNNYDDTINCINSIIKNEKNSKYKIIVVDNNSTNDSSERLKKVKEIVLIQSNENLGFSGGNNLGIKYAMQHNAEYILLLNNDTIITKNLISNLHSEYVKHPDIGVLGCRIMYNDDKTLVNFNGGNIDYYKGTAIIYGKNAKYVKENNKFKYTGYLTGCCMFFGLELVKKIGLLPEDYFMYYEDVDFCHNVIKNNCKLGILTSSVLYHKESSASGGGVTEFAVEWTTRSRLIFIKKHCKKIIALPFFYLTRIMILFKYIISGNIKFAKALLKGLR